MRRQFGFALAVVLCGAAIGCGEGESEGEDPIDEAFLVDEKADAYGVRDASPEALGVLRVANELSKADLVAKVGVTSRPATNIVAARPLATLKALDDVPYVGSVAFSKILSYAKNNGFVPAPSQPTLAFDGSFEVTRAGRYVLEIFPNEGDVVYLRAQVGSNPPPTNSDVIRVFVGYGSAFAQQPYGRAFEEDTVRGSYGPNARVQDHSVAVAVTTRRHFAVVTTPGPLTISLRRNLPSLQRGSLFAEMESDGPVPSADGIGPVTSQLVWFSVNRCDSPVRIKFELGGFRHTDGLYSLLNPEQIVTVSPDGTFAAEIAVGPFRLHTIALSGRVDDLTGPNPSLTLDDFSFSQPPEWSLYMADPVQSALTRNRPIQTRDSGSCYSW